MHPSSAFAQYDLAIDFTDPIITAHPNEIVEVFATLTSEPTSTEVLHGTDLASYQFTFGSLSAQHVYDFEFIQPGETPFLPFLDTDEPFALHPGEDVTYRVGRLIPETKSIPLGSYRVRSTGILFIVDGQRVQATTSDTLTINVVPEPSAALLLIIATLPLIAARPPGATAGSPSSAEAGTRRPLPDKPDSGTRSTFSALVIVRSPAGQLT